MNACENLENCGFAKKYENDKKIKSLIEKYCKSKLQNECKRKAYKKAHGLPPSDDMLPDGQMNA